MQGSDMDLINKILQKHCRNRTRLLAILKDIQNAEGFIPDEAMTR
jgi:hypothetical protein